VSAWNELEQRVIDTAVRQRQTSLDIFMLASRLESSGQHSVVSDERKGLLALNQETWDELDQQVIDTAVRQWRQAATLNSA